MLMKYICGFIRPDSGKIFVAGKELGRDVDVPPDPLLELKDQGKTIQLSSQNREDIDLLCDNMCKMENGVLVS